MTAARLRSGAVAVVAALLASGCSTGPDGASSGASDQGPGRGRPALPASTLAPLVDRVPELSLAPLPAMRLADGLTPPTNRWFSGLVFGDQPQPVFPLPLAFSVDDRSFGAGLPQIVTSATNIVGSHQRDVAFTVAGAASTTVSAYDVGSVTLELRDDQDRPLGRTTVAEGSPFVTHVATADEELSTSVTFTGSGDVAVAETPTGRWGIRMRGATLAGDSLSLSEGDSVVLFPIPHGGTLDDMARVATPITGTTSSYAVGADDVTSTITYETADGGPTAFGVLPHQASALSDACTVGTFPTVYGRMTLCPGATLAWSVPRQDASRALDLAVLSPGQRATLARQVTKDVTDLPDPPADTYFGGKWAYRTAQLMEIARQVGAHRAAGQARRQLTEVLERWTEPQGCAQRAEFCFGYDPAWKGVVGQTVAFGSEVFNDHHFHYGYFLYAAAVLAAEQPSVVDDLKPVMTLLAADVAGGTDTGITPQWRPFDVNAAHSWAAGTGEFADGNNQESSSEAVTAWAGLQLWAEAVGDDDLARQATWMMSSEADSATTYWTDFDTSDPVYDGFTHGVMGINWGGKRDYATWFSAEPSAILGIQLIPMSPSSGYLAGDPARIRSNTAEGGRGVLGDYALMYAGLAGRADARAALRQARRLPDASIDQGDSRSYLLAHLMVSLAAG